MDVLFQKYEDPSKNYSAIYVVSFLALIWFRRLPVTSMAALVIARKRAPDAWQQRKSKSVSCCSFVSLAQQVKDGSQERLLPPILLKLVINITILLLLNVTTNTHTSSTKFSGIYISYSCRSVSIKSQSNCYLCST